ncbi:TMP-TENI-domain-containing protein [Rhizodiscina lignyota]|uniref:TMP-TENI-domain-containing protein n=1 Tax=Rhizodiscina lignyota TaxID=1504668 RepID=A0A9P4MCC8_9PEZI|nr:TMP-TENI-domain-containing protein [Rhizodiscina lignyota]
MPPNYTLYLVTDSTAPILKGRDLAKIVKDAIDGGVTIVQYRDKTSDTADLIRTAKELHKITKAAGVPLLINDRIDVALAVGTEGVHIGQDDIDIATARKILGPEAIIGVTASSEEEAIAAVKGGANYLGLGTVFATPTKENTKSIIGASGVRDILSRISQLPNSEHVGTVCIGGINAANVQRVLYQSHSPDKSLDGVAVVSAIVGADEPRTAAQHLYDLILRAPAFARAIHQPSSLTATITTDLIIAQVPKIAKALAEKTPLCHNMTNLVVQNIAANVALCVGASPIMSNNGLEAPDLAKLGGALVINMGTVTPEGLSNNLQALRAYNAVGGPVVFDPVGAGATQQRRNGVKTLMAGGYFDLIKGNEMEIKAVAGVSGEQMRGVDSGPGTLSLEEKCAMVRSLAGRERCLALMTGSVDVLSDGRRTVAVMNGHGFLGSITGSGCTLGTTAAAYLAVHKEDTLMAVLAAMLHFEIAAERAAARDEVRGPGTFVPAWLDELHLIKQSSLKGDEEWVREAKVVAL